MSVDNINQIIDNDNDNNNDQQQLANNLANDDENEQNDNENNDNSPQVQKYNDNSRSPTPSESGSISGSSTSLNNLTVRSRKSKIHPLSSSYSEWLNNWFSISIPAIGFLGCQLSLALQNGFVTPELEELGISQKLVGYTWLAPPLTGTIVQPLIGITSDMMDVNIPNSFASSYGRRRPFVALGSIMVVICLLLFSNSRHIGILFGDSDGNTGNAAIIAIISFWFLDISINIVQAPLRALISDIIPSQHHTTANGIFGFANGLGAIIGYALGYGMAYNNKLGGGLSALFALASFTVICTSCIMLYLTDGELAMDISSTSLSEIITKHYQNYDNNTNNHDESIIIDNDDDTALLIEPDDNNEPPPAAAVVLAAAVPVEPVAPHERTDSELEIVIASSKSKYERIKEALLTMPKPISRAFMVQFWLYFGLFASYIYLTDWFGKKVTNGDPNSDIESEVNKYRTGVRIASIGLSFGAIIAVIGSMILPLIIRKFGYRWTWFVCMLFYGIMLLMTPFCNSINMGLFIVTCLGIGQAAAMVIGWSIVTETVANSDKKGVYTTLFTTSHTIPELTVALIAGQIIILFDNHVSAVLAVGGVAALFGANSALYIVEPKKWLAKQSWLKRQNRINRNRQNG